jgi:hypothetical protein
MALRLPGSKVDYGSHDSGKLMHAFAFLGALSPDRSYIHSMMREME